MKKILIYSLICCVLVFSGCDKRPGALDCREAVVQEFKTTEVHPVSYSTEYVVRDNEGAVWLIEVDNEDFIRGIFDGDGCVHLSKDKRRKSSYLRQCVFLGTRDILSYIPKLFELEDKIVEYKKICRLAYYKISDLQKIFDVLYYSDNVPCLQRKKLKFEETLNVGKNESVEVKDFMRNGKLVKGFNRERAFENGRRSSQNRKKKEKEESE